MSQVQTNFTAADMLGGPSKVAPVAKKATAPKVSAKKESKPVVAEVVVETPVVEETVVVEEVVAVEEAKAE